MGIITVAAGAAGTTKNTTRSVTLTKPSDVDRLVVLVQLDRADDYMWNLQVKYGGVQLPLLLNRQTSSTSNPTKRFGWFEQTDLSGASGTVLTVKAPPYDHVVSAAYWVKTGATRASGDPTYAGAFGYGTKTFTASPSGGDMGVILPTADNGGGDTLHPQSPLVDDSRATYGCELHVAHSADLSASTNLGVSCDDGGAHMFAARYTVAASGGKPHQAVIIA